MLVLTRKKEQKIWIPAANCWVTIVEIGEHSVRLGFDAPLDVKIKRGEIVPESEAIPPQRATSPLEDAEVPPPFTA